MATLVLGACAHLKDPNFTRETAVLIAPQKAHCMAMFPTTCLQVRESGSEPWSNMHDDISGFVFEPGYDYVLKVGIYQVPNPPADASNRELRLIELISKTPTIGLKREK